jgi:hypothetical protein
MSADTGHLFLSILLIALTKQRLRRIFGLKREEVTRGWIKVHNEELHHLYSSRTIVRIIKSRRMRWAGHVAQMGKMKNVYSLFV